MTEVNSLLPPPRTGRPETSDNSQAPAEPSAQEPGREAPSARRGGFAQALEQLSDAPEPGAAPPAEPPVPRTPPEGGVLPGELAALAGDQDAALPGAGRLPDQPASPDSSLPDGRGAPGDAAGPIPVPPPGNGGTSAFAPAAGGQVPQAIPRPAGFIPGGVDVPADGESQPETGRADNGRAGSGRYFDSGGNGAQIASPPAAADQDKLVRPATGFGQRTDADILLAGVQSDDQAVAPGVAVDAPGVRPAAPALALPAPQIFAGTPPPMHQIIVAIEKLTLGERINLRLDPPDLGSVSIRLEITDGVVRAVLAADRPDTVDLLTRHRGELTQLLSDAGFDKAETRIDLAGRDLGRNGANPPSPDDQPPLEVAIEVPGDRQDWQAGREQIDRDIKDGRLDIRV